MNLATGKFKPYLKPGDKPVYVSKESNHPKNILNSIPLSVNNRISAISSDEASFNASVQPHQEALKDAGFQHQLKYEPIKARSKKNRSRNIIWYNPPFNKSVKTNVGQKFLKLIDKHFPKSNKLHKIFNRSTIKISYSCTDNVKRTIEQNNKKNLNRPIEITTEKTCNCRIKENCPLKGTCLKSNLIYQATVETNNSKENYIGITETTFKTRFNNHKASFKNPKLEKATELSKHIWDLKKKEINNSISWIIV